jgi:uronate dehydrogenase
MADSTAPVLITGAAGRIGGFLRPRLLAAGYRLRLLDTAPLSTVDAREEVVLGSITDPPAIAAASAGASAVVHLAGFATEAQWPDILHSNIHGTWCVLEAARAAGVRRVVLASSNHAVGFEPRGDAALPDDTFPRPDGYYGVSKVAKEALGSLYADRHGMDVVCLRIGSCAERPPDRRALSTWLSPDDAGRLVVAALSVPSPGFRVVWGVSANTRRWWSAAGGDAIGYHPADDAEAYVADLPAEPEPAVTRVGGPWATPHS